MFLPGHALHEKGLQRQIGVGTLVSSQERRALVVPLINRLSTAGQPRVNRWSTADFVPPSVPGHALHEKGLQRQKRDGSLVSSQKESASRPADKPVMNRWSIGCQPVVNRGFCSFIGLHRIYLIRASGESFKRRVFDALERTREARTLGEQFRWHPVLPDPAPPPHRAPRPDPPVVCQGFGLDRFT